MIYHTCPRCGANLDPGERCDCQPQTEMPPQVRPTPGAAGVITVKNVDHDAEYLLVGDGASQNFGKETEFTVQYLSLIHI